MDLNWIDGVKVYQDTQYRKLFRMSDITDLNGRDILEVGGDGNFATARSLANASKKPVVVAQPDANLNLKTSYENIILINSPAERIDFSVRVL